MRRVTVWLLILSLSLCSCKKDTVDGSSIQSFQTSTNDMATNLSTIQQIKFNEALYILKKFGVNSNDDLGELQELSKLLNGKNVTQIMALADEVARKNDVDWSSTAPPSLGMTNIFTSIQPKEHDPNDIPAKKMALEIKPVQSDRTESATGLQIKPLLLDDAGKALNFDNAGLEAVLEVSSGGIRLATSRQILQSSDFPGFILQYRNLPAEKILDGKIDVRVVVQTSKNTVSMLRAGIPVNGDVLKQPSKPVFDSLSPGKDSVNTQNPKAPMPDTENTKASGSSQQTVMRFLKNLGTQNLRKAYDEANNPSWGSYDAFSNPATGFGGVKSLQVGSIKTLSQSKNKAKVRAVYTIKNAEGQERKVSAIFDLSAQNGKWTITSYNAE